MSIHNRLTGIIGPSKCSLAAPASTHSHYMASCSLHTVQPKVVDLTPQSFLEVPLKGTQVLSCKWLHLKLRPTLQDIHHKAGDATRHQHGCAFEYMHCALCAMHWVDATRMRYFHSPKLASEPGRGGAGGVSTWAAEGAARSGVSVPSVSARAFALLRSSVYLAAEPLHAVIGVGV